MMSITGKISLVFFFAAGSVFGQYIDEDFQTYLDYSMQLFDKYFTEGKPALDEHVQKSMQMFNEYWDKIKPYHDRWLYDPDYSFEDYNRDTKAIRDAYYAKSSGESSRYYENSRPLRDAYYETSSNLWKTYEYKKAAGLSLTQDDFNDLMKEFFYKSKAELTERHRKSKHGNTPQPVIEKTEQNRRTRYTAATGFSETRLLDLYSSADTNGDDSLSWDELRLFQEKLVLRFSYIVNRYALDPVSFINNGGGDCEDWAIITAGLLRFWDVDGYVGTLMPGNNQPGHAVCLVKSAQKPEAYAFYAVYGVSGKEEYYIPVDYQHVGKLSHRMFESWLLTDLYSPEEIYGAWM